MQVVWLEFRDSELSHEKARDGDARSVPVHHQKVPAAYASMSEFKLHLATHKDEKSQCETCGKLVEINELRQHMRLHLITFPCYVLGCPFAGKNKTDFNIHKTNVHDLVCNFWGRIDKYSKTKMKAHRKLHQTDTPGVFKCSLIKCRPLRFSSIESSRTTR